MSETDRTRIERQRPDHSEGLFAALRDPRIYKFLDDAPPKSLDEVRNRVIRLMAGGPPDGSELWLNWSVFVGDTIFGFTQATIEQEGRASIAYVLSPSVWGTGVAQRAAELTFDVLARSHGIKSLMADTEVGNLHSQALLDRLGFHEQRRDAVEIFYARQL